MFGEMTWGSVENMICGGMTAEAQEREARRQAFLAANPGRKEEWQREKQVARMAAAQAAKIGGPLETVAVWYREAVLSGPKGFRVPIQDQLAASLEKVAGMFAWNAEKRAAYLHAMGGIPKD